LGNGDSDSDDSHEGASPKLPPNKKAGKKAARTVELSSGPDPEVDTGEDRTTSPKPIRAIQLQDVDLDSAISENSEDKDSNSHIDLSMQKIPPQTKSPPKRQPSIKKTPAYKVSPVPFLRTDGNTPTKEKMINGDLVKVSSGSGYLTTQKSDRQKEADRIAR
jgi:hypothetical protein